MHEKQAEEAPLLACMHPDRVLTAMTAVQVLLAAGDTFRAAAAEQLQLWAGRSGVAVHAATRENARPDNVLYEAVSKAGPLPVALMCSTGLSPGA